MSTMSSCRACGSTNLFLYLPLGSHPPANAFVRPERAHEPELSFPLDTHVCLECALVQVPDRLPPNFYADYAYTPSGSSTMPLHFAALARHFREHLTTGSGQLVVDIGCNDGLLLGACRDEGLEALGVDPAANIAELARAKGIEVVNEYFGLESALRIKERYGPAQVIVTTNTFNHIDDLGSFMAGVTALLAPDGTFVIEAPQALTCILGNQFDTVYHEHLSVFSVASIVMLGKASKLELVDIQELDVHGGSMRFYLRRGGAPAPVVEACLRREREAGLFERATYVAHAKRVAQLRDDLLALLHELKGQGKRLAGYGAPAKGSTLLNYCGIGPDLLEFLVDRNTIKQGRLSPGSRIPVVSPEVLAKQRPDYLLVLAWNFAEEIIGQQEAFREGGGKFILPIPAPRIVG